MHSRIARAEKEGETPSVDRGDLWDWKNVLGKRRTEENHVFNVYHSFDGSFLKLPNVNIESILSVQYNLMHGFTEDLEEHRTFGAFLGSTSSGKNEHFYDICKLQGF